MDLICAYRENGCVVGIKTLFDYVNVRLPEGTPDEEAELQRQIICFGNLTAPQIGHINIRNVIVARATGVPDDIANDAVELVNTVGGQQTGFNVAEMLEPFSNFDPGMPPMAVQAQRPEAPPLDLPVELEGRQICPVCGESNCGWLAEGVRNR